MRTLSDIDGHANSEPGLGLCKKLKIESEPRGERQDLRSRGADSTGAYAARQSHARVWLITLEPSHIDSGFENFQLN